MDKDKTTFRDKLKNTGRNLVEDFLSIAGISLSPKSQQHPKYAEMQDFLEQMKASAEAHEQALIDAGVPPTEARKSAEEYFEVYTTQGLLQMVKAPEQQQQHNVDPQLAEEARFKAVCDEFYGKPNKIINLDTEKRKREEREKEQAGGM
jgi:hypothetical protein